MKWIDITKELPEDYMWVLFGKYDPDYKEFSWQVGRKYPEGNIEFFESADFGFYGEAFAMNGFLPTEATHWMKIENAFRHKEAEFIYQPQKRNGNSDLLIEWIVDIE